jgi:predicted transposase YdaD
MLNEDLAKVSRYNNRQAIIIFNFSHFSPAYRRNRKVWHIISFCLRHHDIKKETQEGVEAMCKIMEDLCRETAEEIAENLINMGTLSFEDIAKATGLSLSEVQRLAENKTA